MGAPTFDTTRARLGDLVAGAAGLLLLISLFLNWYSIGPIGLSGWDALSLIDVILFLIALVAIAAAVMRMAGALPAGLPATVGQIVLGLGAIATLLVLLRLIFVPSFGGIDLSRSFGIFVALISALGVTLGGWMTWNEEGKPRPGAAGTGAGPLGAGAPQGGAPHGAQAVPVYRDPVASGPAATGPAAAAPAATMPAPGGPGAGAEAPPSDPKADWHPDPRGEKRLRYWDGTRWTDHVAD